MRTSPYTHVPLCARPLILTSLSTDLLHQRPLVISASPSTLPRLSAPAVSAPCAAARLRISTPCAAGLVALRSAHAWSAHASTLGARRLGALPAPAPVRACVNPCLPTTPVVDRQCILHKLLSARRPAPDISDPPACDCRRTAARRRRCAAAPAPPPSPRPAPPRPTPPIPPRLPPPRRRYPRRRRRRRRCRRRRPCPARPDHARGRRFTSSFPRRSTGERG